MSAAQDGRGS